MARALIVYKEGIRKADVGRETGTEKLLNRVRKRLKTKKKNAIAKQRKKS